MALVSVIVPVYKVEAYLCRCVDSILEQTFEDLELILVDDGSPDRSGTICDEYVRQDSRVHVIHQKNGGLSAARNAALDWLADNSDSQWVTFVDSDDWIHPQMLETLLRYAQSGQIKVAVCGYQETAEWNREFEPADPEGILWNPEDYFLEHNTNAVIACAKLYHRSCFSDLRYPVGRIHEDEFTTYQVLFSQKEIVVTEVPLYFYFQNMTGITRSEWAPKRLDILEAQRAQLQFFKEKGFVRAHDRVAVWYAGKLCQQRRNIEMSSLPEKEKRTYRIQIQKALHHAVQQYWRIYCRRCNLDIFFEMIPVLKRIYGVIRKTGEVSGETG